MEQLTHTVRRSNWINIIRQCQDRPAGTTAKQWLAENDISEKSYYYWLRKIRREVCEQEGLQEVTTPSALSFVEIPVKTALDTVNEELSCLMGVCPVRGKGQKVCSRTAIE